MMDIILYQRISGGWEFQYTGNHCDTYTGFGYTAAEARSKLFRKLGWTDYRFNRADFRKF